MHPDSIHIQTYYSEFHFPEFTSAVADMKNSVADRNNGQPRFNQIKSYLCNAKIKVSCGQAKLTLEMFKVCFFSCAGLFIHAHLGFDWSGVWMHVDMAAPAMVSNVVLTNCLDRSSLDHQNSFGPPKSLINSEL